MLAVELVGGNAEDEIIRAAVAGHALGTAGDSPGLFFSGHLELDVDAIFADKLGIGLFLVPPVGIAGPFLVLARHQASLNPPIAQRQRLDDDGSFAELPAPVASEADGCLSRQGEVALSRGAIDPARRIDRVGNDSRGDLVVGDR